MPSNRHSWRSLTATAAAGIILAAASPARAQEASVQALFERGALSEVVERAASDRGNPEATYLAAQALAKMDNADRAREEYGRLRENGAADWKAIAESGDAMAAGDFDAARAAAERAVAANGDNPYTHYQKGLVATRQSRFRDAADAFNRAVELKPDLAYAHYYSGIAHQRLKEIARMSEHLEYFLKLAPNAPEQATVQSILRTVRPR